MTRALLLSLALFATGCGAAGAAPSSFGDQAAISSLESELLQTRGALGRAEAEVLALRTDLAHARQGEDGEALKRTRDRLARAESDVAALQATLAERDTHCLLYTSPSPRD